MLEDQTASRAREGRHGREQALATRFGIKRASLIENGSRLPVLRTRCRRPRWSNGLGLRWRRAAAISPSNSIRGAL